MDRFVTDRLSFDESGHEHALGFDEGDHLGADAGGGRELAGLALESPVDAEQAAGLCRDPHDEDLALDRDAVVPVRDAAAQRLDRPRAAGPTRHPIHDQRADELHLHRSIAYTREIPRP